MILFAKNHTKQHRWGTNWLLQGTWEPWKSQQCLLTWCEESNFPHMHSQAESGASSSNRSCSLHPWRLWRSTGQSPEWLVLTPALSRSLARCSWVSSRGPFLPELFCESCTVICNLSWKSQKSWQTSLNSWQECRELVNYASPLASYSLSSRCNEATTQKVIVTIMWAVRTKCWSTKIWSGASKWKVWGYISAALGCRYPNLNSLLATDWPPTKRSLSTSLDRNLK